MSRASAAPTWLSLTLAAALLGGCGNGDEGSFQAGGAPAPTGSLSGRVLGETGQAQTGVRVIANERTTDAKVEAISGVDGSFQLSLPTGVYDLGLDRPGDTQTATCFYGPLTVAGQEQRDFVLRQSNGRPAGHLSGKLLLQPGVPASNRQVGLRSGHLPGPNTPPRVSTTTAGDGTFETS